MKLEPIVFEPLEKNARYVPGFIPRVRTQIEQIFQQIVEEPMAENAHDKVVTLLSELSEQVAIAYHIVRERHPDVKANIGRLFWRCRKVDDKYSFDAVRDQTSLSLLEKLPGDRVFEFMLAVVVQETGELHAVVQQNPIDEMHGESRGSDVLRDVMEHTEGLADEIATKVKQECLDCQLAGMWATDDVVHLLYGPVMQTFDVRDVANSDAAGAFLEHVLLTGARLITSFYDLIVGLEELPDDTIHGCVFAFIDWVRNLLVTGTVTPLIFYTESTQYYDWHNQTYTYGWAHSHSQLQRNPRISNSLQFKFTRSVAGGQGLMAGWHMQDHKFAKDVFVTGALRMASQPYAQHIGHDNLPVLLPYLYIKAPPKDFSGDESHPFIVDTANDFVGVAMDILAQASEFDSYIRDADNPDTIKMRLTTQRKVINWLSGLDWLGGAAVDVENASMVDGSALHLLLDFEGTSLSVHSSQPELAGTDIENRIVLRLEHVSHGSTKGVRLSANRPIKRVLP